MSLLHDVPGYIHLNGPLAGMPDMHEKLANERIATTFRAYQPSERSSQVQVIHEPGTAQYSFIAQLLGAPTIAKNSVAARHYDFSIYPTLNLGHLSVVSFEKGLEVSGEEQLAAVNFHYEIPGLMLPDDRDVAHFVSVVGDFQDHLLESGR